MPVYKTAAFQVREDGVTEALEVIRTFVGQVKESEPGTLQYTSVQAASDPTRFLHFFIFEDEAAERVHASSDHVNEFTDVLYPLVEGGGVVFTDYRIVASTWRPGHDRLSPDRLRFIAANARARLHFSGSGSHIKITSPFMGLPARSCLVAAATMSRRPLGSMLSSFMALTLGVFLFSVSVA